MNYKFTLTIVASLMLGATQLWAQAPSTSQAIERAISLYRNAHPLEARAELMDIREGLSTVRDRSHIEKIDYYIAMCESELRTNDMEGRLKRFLAEHHGSSYANEVEFALGSHYCTLADDSLAEEQLKKVDYERLDPENRDRYNLRMGYIFFKRGDYQQSEVYFSQIANGGDYGDHATYYKSYIAYANDDMAQAKAGFESLLNSPLYRDLMPYYLLQLDFKSHNYQAVVDRGDALVESTTKEQAAEIYSIMAESYFQLGDFNKAVSYTNKFESAGGVMDRLVRYIKGYSLYRQTLYAEAIPLLREVCGPNSLLTQYASYNLADCYLHQGDKQNAMHAFAMAAGYDGYTLNDKDKLISEDALFNYGKLQYELGGGVFNEAINTLTRYIELYPSSERRAEAQELLIAAYYNSHNYAAAYDAIKSIAQPDGETQLALQKIAYFNGLESYSAGELEEATASLSESLSVGQNAKYNALAAFWLGEIAYSQGDSRMALQRYRQFVSRAPRGGRESMMALYNMGYCYFNNEEFAAAAEQFDKFLAQYTKRDSYRADAYNRRADIHYSKREFAEAVEAYDKSISLSTPERYYAEYQRAITLGVQNKREQKIESLQRIIRTDRGDYVDAATYELGHSYIANEQYANGVKILEQFIGQYPNSKYHSQALSDLGLAYMNLGDRERAFKYYDMVVKESPQSAQSKSAMQGIRDIYLAQGDADAYFDYAQKLGLEGNVSQMTRDSLSYAAAQKLYLEGKSSQATASFENYLKNYPKGYYRTDALFFMSDCLVRDEKTEEAITHLKELSSLGKNQYTERVLDKLSSICYKSERWEEAAKAYRALYDNSSESAVKINAASGYVASTLKYAEGDALVAMADDVEKMAEVNDVARRKARYAKATVLRNTGKEQEAMKIYTTLSKEVKSAEGAEARYRLIAAEVESKSYDKAEKMIYDFSDSKTPQNYWLAKAFILLGDIYVARGDEFQARATYQSVVDGYSPADDGIVDEAKAKIKKMSNGNTL